MKQTKSLRTSIVSAQGTSTNIISLGEAKLQVLPVQRCILYSTLERKREQGETSSGRRCSPSKKCPPSSSCFIASWSAIFSSSAILPSLPLSFPPSCTLCRSRVSGVSPPPLTPHPSHSFVLAPSLGISAITRAETKERPIQLALHGVIRELPCEIYATNVARSVQAARAVGKTSAVRVLGVVSHSSNISRCQDLFKAYNLTHWVEGSSRSSTNNLESMSRKLEFLLSLLVQHPAEPILLSRIDARPWSLRLPRDTILSTADLWYFGNVGAGYHPSDNLLLLSNTAIYSAYINSPNITSCPELAIFQLCRRLRCRCFEHVDVSLLKPTVGPMNSYLRSRGERRWTGGCRARHLWNPPCCIGNDTSKDAIAQQCYERARVVVVNSSNNNECPKGIRVSS